MATFSPCDLAHLLPELREARRLWLGFSGGLDSTVLLHALCRLMPASCLAAIHVNHGLSPRADTWQSHCENTCAALGVPLIVEQVTVDRGATGVEAAAREQRYGVFAHYVKPGDLLLLAHHRDDQVETVLFRLLRGSGPRGLAGMPARRPLGAGKLLRPLLAIGRDALEDWARREGLDWVEDESNAATGFDRNFLRHQVLPLLSGRWPDVDTRILRSARHCAESGDLLRDLAEADLDSLGEREERIGWSLPVAGMIALSRQRQANLLRCWVDRHHLPLPGHRPLAAVLDDLLPAREDAIPLVCYGSAHFRRHGGRLFLLPGEASALASPPADEVLPWDPSAGLPLPGGFFLVANSGVGVAIQHGAKLEVRFRQGGERCRPLGRSGSRPLKKVLQDYGLEPWLRDLVPLIHVDGELAAVGDLFVCEGFQARDGGGLVLRWRHGARC